MKGILEGAHRRGLELGEGRASTIRALVEGRARGLARSATASLREIAERLEARAPALAAEQRGLARACLLEPEQLLVLDGGVLDVLRGVSTSEPSLSLYIHGPRGPVLGGSWCLQAAEAEALESHHVEGGVVLGLPGSLGLVGIADAGHCVQANLLRPGVPGRGLPGSALLRLALTSEGLAAARRTIESTEVLDGRSWLLADGKGLFGIEQLAEQCVLTRVSPRTGHVHTNHCFDPALRQREAQPRSAVSFRRMEIATTLYVQERPSDAVALLDFLAEVETASFPRDPDLRASVQWAIEVVGGRMWLRRGQGPVEMIELHRRTP